MRVFRKKSVFVAVFLCMAAGVGATETRTYTYDARGRLGGAASSGTVNSGQVDAYCYDKAGNRTKVVGNVNGQPASCPACVLTARGNSFADDATHYPYVEKIGFCPSRINLSYTVQKVSGVGSYEDGGFEVGPVLLPGESMRAARIYPVARSVPVGQQMVLSVKFSTNDSGVQFEDDTVVLSIIDSY